MTTEVKVAALLAALATGWVACTPRESAEMTDGAAESNAGTLVTTMEVEAGGEMVRLTLHVTNPTTEPVDLEFPSSQRYDFAISRVDGESVWHWSAARSFAQALGTETLPGGGSLRYEAEWPSEGRSGEYVATGEVTALNHDIRQSVRFELAGGE